MARVAGALATSARTCARASTNATHTAREPRRRRWAGLDGARVRAHMRCSASVDVLPPLSIAGAIVGEISGDAASTRVLKLWTPPADSFPHAPEDDDDRE